MKKKFIKITTTPTGLHSLDKEEVLNFLYLRVGISGTQLSRKLRQGVWGTEGEMKSRVCRSTMYVLHSSNNFTQAYNYKSCVFTRQFTYTKLMRFVVIKKRHTPHYYLFALFRYIWLILTFGANSSWYILVA